MTRPRKCRQWRLLEGQRHVCNRNYGHPGECDPVRRQTQLHHQQRVDELADQIWAHILTGCPECKRANAAAMDGAPPDVVLEMSCLAGSSMRRQAAALIREEMTL